MKKYLFAFLFLSFNFLAQAQDFITRWDLSKPGGPNTELYFYVGTVGTCSYTWETIPGGATGSGTFIGSGVNITGLPAAAMIRLKIDTTNFRWFYTGCPFTIDRKRLMDVEQWGAVHWNSMSCAFNGCENLNITSLDVPNLSNVTNMSAMFCNCIILNGPININTWNTSNVKDMNYMFYYATSFNQSIGNWNTSNVTNMAGMFDHATSFNQSIGNWQLNNQGVYMINMLDSSGLDCMNYSSTLVDWSNNVNIPANRTLGAEGVKYHPSIQNARNYLKNTKGWTINGDGIENNCTGIGLNDKDLSNSIKIFPNPVHHLLQIESSSSLQNAEICVLNLMGQNIATYKNISNNTFTIDMSALTPGNYFIQIKDSNNSFVMKVLKE